MRLPLPANLRSDRNGGLTKREKLVNALVDGQNVVKRPGTQRDSEVGETDGALLICYNSALYAVVNDQLWDVAAVGGPTVIEPGAQTLGIGQYLCSTPGEYTIGLGASCGFSEIIVVGGGGDDYPDEFFPTGGGSGACGRATFSPLYTNSLVFSVGQKGIYLSGPATLSSVGAVIGDGGIIANGGDNGAAPAGGSGGSIENFDFTGGGATFTHLLSGNQGTPSGSGNSVSVVVDYETAGQGARCTNSPGSTDGLDGVAYFVIEAV